MKYCNSLSENEFGCLLEIIEKTENDVYTLYKMIDFENTKNTSILLDKKEAISLFLAFTTLRKSEPLKIEVFQDIGWGRVFLDDNLKTLLNKNYVVRWSGTTTGQISTTLDKSGILSPYCYESEGVGVFMEGELWDLSYIEKNINSFSEKWQLARIKKAIAINKIYNNRD